MVSCAILQKITDGSIRRIMFLLCTLGSCPSPHIIRILTLIKLFHDLICNLSDGLLAQVVAAPETEHLLALLDPNANPKA